MQIQLLQNRMQFYSSIIVTADIVEVENESDGSIRLCQCNVYNNLTLEITRDTKYI